MPRITISQVSDSSLSQFIELPYKLYAGDPHWVPDLKRSVRDILELKHPFWLHGQRKLFMAHADGKPAGRVAAIINRAHNAYHNEKCGFFGFFESVNDRAVSAALLKSAKAWLAENGMTVMRGPMNPSTNESCGLLVSGFGSDPKLMMPYNPPYYGVHLEEFGLAKAKDLHAYIRFADSPMSPRVEKIIARVESRGNIRLRNIHMTAFDKELALVREIYNDAWSENWGFVPITPEEMASAAKELKSIIIPRFVWFIEIDNEPVGFGITLPDVNVALKPLGGALSAFNIIPFLLRLGRVRQGRLVMLGVKKEFRTRGLELLLIKQMIFTARKLKWNHAELSWILEDNDKIINVINEMGGRLYKTYRIYEMPITHDTDTPVLEVQSKT